MPQHPTLQPAVERLEPKALLRWRTKRIDSTPDLSGCAATQMLVCSNRVVPEAKGLHRLIAMLAINNKAFQLCFQRSEETLNPPVLPRAGRLRELQRNTSPTHEGTEAFRTVHRMIVQAQRSRFSVLADGEQHIAREGPRIEAAQVPEQNRQARTVVDDAQYDSVFSAALRHDCGVRTPNPIARDWWRYPMLERLLLMQCLVGLSL